MVFNSHTCFHNTQSPIHYANSFASSSFSHWHVCSQLQPFLGKLFCVGGFLTPLQILTWGGGQAWAEGQGKARRHSLFANTLSSPSSCFGTWRLQSYFFPVASFSFHLLQGLPVKSNGTCLMGGKKCDPFQIHCLLLPAKSTCYTSLTSEDHLRNTESQVGGVALRSFSTKQAAYLFLWRPSKYPSECPPSFYGGPIIPLHCYIKIFNYKIKINIPLCVPLSNQHCPLLGQWQPLRLMSTQPVLLMTASYSSPFYQSVNCQPGLFLDLKNCHFIHPHTDS